MRPVLPENLATGVIRIDRNGRIDWLNQAAADLLSRPLESVTGEAARDTSTALADWRRRVLEAERPLQVSEERLIPEGPLVDAIARLDGDEILIELHPVGERVHQREKARRADRQQSIGRMARRLAHELRNPLAGVRGAAQLIEAAGSDPAVSRHARMIQREVDRATALIERFAAGGRRKSGAVNTHQVLEEAAELVLAERHGALTIHRNFDPSIPPLLADAGQLHQLFLNLLRNSMQADAVRIRLTSRIEHHSPLIDDPARHAVRIDIDDDGHGVPASLRDQLFLPLVSGRDRGSGFGLAVAQQIARGHGGLIEYVPLETGSRFSLRLPLIEAAEKDQ